MPTSRFKAYVQLMRFPLVFTVWADVLTGYFLACHTGQKPAELHVRGPLRLQISTRLDFDQHAGMSQGYVVRVALDSTSRSYSLKSRASQVAMYPEMTEIVPGMAQTFTIKAPAGMHTIVLRLDGTTATGATLRVRVPERELKVGNHS